MTQTVGVVATCLPFMNKKQKQSIWNLNQIGEMVDCESAGSHIS